MNILKKNLRSQLFLGIATLASFSASQLAMGKEYILDTSHSNVNFTIRHLVSKVQGGFKTFDGTILFDPENPEKAKILAEVKADSINTENKKRDDHLRSDDFFSASKFPKLKFVSTQVSSAEGKKYKMVGDLTLRGVTKPVTFDVEYLGEADDPWGGHRAGFTANAKISRKDFGMSWNKTLDKGGVVLSDDVEIQINIEALEKGPEKNEDKSKGGTKKP